MTAWHAQERELETLSLLLLPQCYTLGDMDCPDAERQTHNLWCWKGLQLNCVFMVWRCLVYVAFLFTHSRVVPQKQLSMPRLELCAAVTGAQLVKLLKNELTFDIHLVILWSDSTTVLTWLHMEIWQFKVFVAMRLVEIQEFTDHKAFHCKTTLWQRTLLSTIIQLFLDSVLCTVHLSPERAGGVRQQRC